ncbi:MAG: ABC transporter substrate-binding protein [Clostridia bacterium]|nr:ABC transporter substrate-binding protein [Clostridia bacterium]
MKKIVSVLLLIALCTLAVLPLASCGKQKKLTVGIVNYVDDASLNQIADNLRSRLSEIATENGTEIEVLYQNCNADTNVLNQILTDYITRGVDLLIGITTPVAVAMQSATEDLDIPVLFSAVSDPVGSGLVDSLTAPGGNLTGTSDYLDTEAVLNLMFAVDPEITSVGLLYDVGQDSSTSAIAAAKTYLAAKGVSVVEKTGNTVPEILLAAQALVADGVDAVFTPTDNSIMNAELSIYETFTEAGIPHYAGADSFALNGAFAGYGVDYANLGRKTADMAKEILFDRKAPKDIAVMTFDNGTATLNTETVAALGLNLDNVKTAITPYCTSIKTVVTAESFDDLN